MSRKIGIYGGTFDPIHLGHIAVVISLMESNTLDHVFFIPAANNPLKERPDLTDKMHRLNMVRRAIKNVPNTSVLTLELQRSGPSYTIDTVHELMSSKRVNDGDSLYLLMGQDVLDGVHRWKSVHELVQIAKPIVAARACDLRSAEWQKDVKLRKIIEAGLCNTPLFDISSTEIRKRLKEGLYCGHLLDHAVLRYIYRYKLYSAS
jgi:nicotinate-nucleotide adenylyltransferase